MFDNLTEKITDVFRNLGNKGKITENNISDALRQVRIALLEADVNFKVVKEFINKVKEKAIGESVLKSLTPDQQFIKIVHDELVEILGSTDNILHLTVQPSIILMVGLQGSGKTTTCAKLANLQKKKNFKPLLVACDIYRPAAIDQLKFLGDQLNVPVCIRRKETDVVAIAKEALIEANKLGCNLLIVDTAGRLHIDEKMMDEVARLKDFLKPQEILFVADAMTGQDAVRVADEFNKKLEITGIVLTKLDGDARGGAAISIKSVTGKPIKFVGISEKIDGLEPFYPDRLATRILGMGDIVSLAEKVEQNITEEEAKKLEAKLKKGEFTFDDFLKQLQQVRKMGALEDLIAMIPGMSQIKELKQMIPGEKEIKRIECMIQSMTKEERDNPSIINGSRKLRIAKGSGTSVQEINQLLKQFEQSQKMIKQMSKLSKMSFPGAGGGGLPGGLNLKDLGGLFR
ncbi:MAG TPA: signal recognition particle protein [bacterium]|nr:signal recognition particle protein [bacterium]